MYYLFNHITSSHDEFTAAFGCNVNKDQIWFIGFVHESTQPDIPVDLFLLRDQDGEASQDWHPRRRLPL